MLLSISVCESNVIPGVDAWSIFTVIQLKWIFLHHWHYWLPQP